MSVISYNQELLRKSIHLSSLWMPVTYYFTDKPTMLWITGVVMVIVLFADVGRHYLPLTGRLFNTLFGNMLRDHEKQTKKLSGASYTLIAGFLVIALFEEPIAIAALGILIVSDAIAALIGRKFGSIKLAYGKSLQGSLAFLLSELAVIYGVWVLYNTPQHFWIAAIIAALLTTITELCSNHFKIDDNLTIPLCFGFSMQAVLVLLP